MATSEDTKAIRTAALDLHRALLDSQVLEIEKATGHPMSANEKLGAALQDPRFLWLRELSGVLALLDAEAAAKPGDEPLQGPTAIEQLTGLVAPPDPDSAFGRRYLRELQESPAVGLAHGALIRLLDRPQP